MSVQHLDSLLDTQTDVVAVALVIAITSALANTNTVLQSYTDSTCIRHARITVPIVQKKGGVSCESALLVRGEQLFKYLNYSAPCLN